MAPSKTSSENRVSSLGKLFPLQRSPARRKTPIRKAKEKIKDKKLQTATPRGQQHVRRWNSLICTSRAAVSSQKTVSCLPARNSSYFQQSPLRSCENNDIRSTDPSITVHIESGGRQLNLPFRPNTTSVDICNDVAVEFNSNIDDVTNWCLYEHLFDGKIERLIEDHETISSVCHRWDPAHKGYFVYRTDPCKHGPVLSPEKAYSSFNSDKDEMADLPKEAQEAKLHLLRECLRSTQRFPDLQGPALVHTGVKSGWKKYICCIRGSGVYFCPRRLMKDPKHMKPLCKYDNIEIYMVKHHFQLIKCPTSFCIAIKMHSQRGCEFQDLKFMAFNSQEDLDKWILALRLAKHGEQLRQNYKKALRLKAQLQNLSEVKVESKEI